MAQPASASERKRVKVYELRENDWFDRGTGFCTTQCILEEGRIFVESEEDSDRILLEVKIKKEDIYQKQQDTLIVWTDHDGVDMALSFQEAEGCSAVWGAISTVQERPPDDTDTISMGPLSLPSPELANLPHIEDVLRRANQTQMGRDSMSKLIIQENYIAKLIPLVETAEDLEGLTELHRLCNIMKTLILYNDTSIIEHVVRDEMILGVVGALEYDPDFPTHKANHRQYLSDESKFKEIVPIQDPEIRKKIHFTYRLQYLKDVVLARILDDPTFSVLNSLIFFHQVDIVQHIQSNAAYLREVFALLHSNDTPTQKRKDAVLLIQQSCAIAKNLQAPGRNALYQNLINCGLFQTITFALQHQDAAVRVAGTDILVAVIDHDALMMRNHVIKAISEKTKPLTETLIELLLVETDFGVKQQIGDAIKVLLDPHAPANGPGGERPIGQGEGYLSKFRGNMTLVAQSDNFLQHFYEHSAKVLFQPLKDLEKRSYLNNFASHEMSTFVILIEILCFFIRQHNYRGKYYILAENFHQRIAQLLSCPQKHLKLSAVKYFRCVLGIRDEFHERQIMQFKLFSPIIDIITTTMPRDNLLNSAALELFDFICRERLKPLIFHLVENYRETLAAITYIDTFQDLILRYEQFIHPAPLSDEQGAPTNADNSFMTSEADTPSTRHVTINGASTRWQGLNDDPDQEAYFNEDDDDEEDELSQGHVPSPHKLPNGLGASPVGKPLVDYADDDEDDELDVANGNLSASPMKKDLDIPTPSPPSPSSSPAPATTPNTPPSSTSTSPPDASAASTTPTRPPQSSQPPKRLRSADEDEDDDDLARFLSGAKRRNSSATSSRASSVTRSVRPAQTSSTDVFSNQNPSHSLIDARNKDETQAPLTNGGDWELVDAPENHVAVNGEKDEPSTTTDHDLEMPDGDPPSNADTDVDPNQLEISLSRPSQADTKPQAAPSSSSSSTSTPTATTTKKAPTTPVRQSTRRTRANTSAAAGGGSSGKDIDGSDSASATLKEKDKDKEKETKPKRISITLGKKVG